MITPSACERLVFKRTGSRTWAVAHFGGNLPNVLSSFGGYQRAAPQRPRDGGVGNAGLSGDILDCYRHPAPSSFHLWLCTRVHEQYQFTHFLEKSQYFERILALIMKMLYDLQMKEIFQNLEI